MVLHEFFTFTLLSNSFRALFRAIVVVKPLCLGRVGYIRLLLEEIYTSIYVCADQHSHRFVIEESLNIIGKI